MLNDATVNKVIAELDKCQDGYALPQAFYCDDDLFQVDMEEIFYKEWIFAGPECEIPNPGDYITFQIHKAPVIVLRDREGELRAFHNFCRHRGSKLCEKTRGKARRLVCPYHQWTYELSGELISARLMGDQINKEDFPLNSIHVTSVEGLLYVCLADTPPDIEKFRSELSKFVAPHEPRRTKIAYESTIIEEANWKLIIENNRECYHCAGSHPELLISLLEMQLPNDERFADEYAMMKKMAEKWDADGIPHRAADGGVEFRAVRLPFREGIKSMTMDGELSCKKLMGDLKDHDLGSVRGFRVPNNWHHFLSEVSIHFRVLPISKDKSELRTTWLVHEDAVEGVDYDPERVAEVWLATNAQDGKLAEVNHQGIYAPGYQPGPYSKMSEALVLNFIDWYKQHLSNQFGAPSKVLQAAE